MTEVQNNKKRIRDKILKKIKQISGHRKKEAFKLLIEDFLPRLEGKKMVLSFSSTKQEINTQPFNEVLALQRRLLLPRVENNDLKIFKIENLKNQLKKGSWNIMEPDPRQCSEVSFNDVDAVIVPAVGFDFSNNRIGRGKGFYDRFLKKIPEKPSYGIGFKEQMFTETLPTTKHDTRVTYVYLF